MEHLYKFGTVLVMTAFLMVFACSCAQTQTDPYTEESENTSESTTSTTDTITTQKQETISTETEAPAEAVPNNWYVEGYSVPDDWIAVMTREKAFEHYDELTGETQEDKTAEEIVETLVNRNILVFEIFHGNGWECKNASISSYDVPQPITSDLFDSVEDLVELVNGTYTNEAAELFLTDNGTPAAFFEQDGELYVDFIKMYNWSTQPFKWQTYLEFTDTDDSTCTFIWHYVTWEYFDYEYNDTEDIYSHHNQMTFRAVRENNEWRLTSPIFDNPELGIIS